MLVAYYQDKLIDANQAKSNLNYFCPVCHEKVLLKHGKFKMPHFAHHHKSKCTNKRIGETQEHLRGKEQLLTFIHHKASLEVYLPLIKQQPDILYNSKLAIEFQCSPISINRLYERVNGYKKMGIKSLWILGEHYRHHFSNQTLNKFFYFSNKVGFCMFFWNTKHKHLEVRFNCRYVYSKLYYQVKYFNELSQLLYFLKYPGILKEYIVNSTLVIREMNLIRKKIFYQDKFVRELQNICYLNHHNLLEAPSICHPKVSVDPIIGKKDFLWKVIIVNQLSDNISLYQLYVETIKIIKISKDYPLVHNPQHFIHYNFMRFIDELINKRYIKLDNNYNITILNNVRWTADYQ